MRKYTSAAKAPNMPRVTTWETSPSIMTSFPVLALVPLDAKTAPALFRESWSAKTSQNL